MTNLTPTEIAITFYPPGKIDIFGHLVAWFTGSRWCHVTVRHITKDVQVVTESIAPYGVRRRAATTYDVSCEQVRFVYQNGRYEVANQWMQSHLGIQYGWLDVLLLALRLTPRTKAMTCGEFVAELLTSVPPDMELDIQLKLEAEPSDWWTPERLHQLLTR